jgi:hypothetical protein
MNYWFNETLLFLITSGATGFPLLHVSLMEKQNGHIVCDYTRNLFVLFRHLHWQHYFSPILGFENKPLNDSDKK